MNSMNPVNLVILLDLMILVNGGMGGWWHVAAPLLRLIVFKLLFSDKIDQNGVRHSFNFHFSLLISKKRSKNGVKTLVWMIAAFSSTGIRTSKSDKPCLANPNLKEHWKYDNFNNS